MEEYTEHKIIYDIRQYDTGYLEDIGKTFNTNFKDFEDYMQEKNNIRVSVEPEIQRQKNPADKSLTFENQITAERYFANDMHRISHFSPGSCLLATVGTDFSEDSKERIKAMYEYTREAGYIVRYVEFQVYHNTFPQASHAATRNTIKNEARIGGTEFVCFVDTDALPEEDMLAKLLANNVSIVTPYVIDPAIGLQLGGPTREINSGLFEQRWIPQCFLLCRTAIFNNPEIHFSYDEAEDGFSSRVTLYGLTQQVDTSQVLNLASPPGRPDSKNWDTRMEGLKERYNREPKRNWISQEEYDEALEKDQYIAVLGDNEQNDSDNKVIVEQKVSEFDVTKVATEDINDGL